MRLTLLGHASVLIEAADQAVLIDPIFDEVFASGTLCQNPPRRLDADALLARTTLLVITHIHLDHFHPPTLARFDRDIPVLAPTHAPLLAGLRELGFTRVIALAPWQVHELPGLALRATPSQFEIDEFGLLAVAGDGSYWHMSDAIVTRDTGAELRRLAGRLDLAAVKYQPLRTLIGYQRGLQALMLDRDELIDGLEAACAAAPAVLFPYFSGFAFHGDHAWANRHISPYQDGEIARLLRRRLQDRAEVLTVAPGDEFQVEAGKVTHRAGASALAGVAEGVPVQTWEPIDPLTLPGLPQPGRRLRLAGELAALLRDEVLPWVTLHLRQASGLFDAFARYQAIWQLQVHLGADQRLCHCIDFRAPEPRLGLDRLHPDAGVFTHVGAAALWQVLRGEAGAEVFWMAGGYRIYEKLLYLDQNGFARPAEEGWALFEQLPDPLTHYLRKAGRRRLARPAD